MKTKILLLLSFVLFANFSFAQEEKTGIEEVLQLINSGKFYFEADKAFAKGGAFIDLTTNANHLIIKNDSINAHLPFFGERHMGAAYGESGTIILDEVIINFTSKIKEKKNSIDVQFSVKNTEDSYQFFLNISENKNASLSVNSNTRSHIRYTGKIRAIKK